MMTIRTDGYRTYLLTLLTIISVFNYVDRLALGLVLQDVKLDLGLSDTQLGLLTGIAFALFYAGMGVPLARWADRGDRITIVSVTTSVWSIAVALCGVATSFVQLLLIRVGVAIGEAGCQPPAFSLIGDYYSRAERTRAISRYLLGWSVALLIGYFAAGWLNEAYGWRATFVVIGLPGLALGLLARLTLKEPRRGRRNENAPRRWSCSEEPREEGRRTDSPVPTLRQVFARLFGNTTFRWLLCCLALSYFFGNGIHQWQPAFFVRHYGLGTGELGTWFAGIYGVGGVLGTYLGGEAATRLAPNNEKLQLIGMSILIVLVGSCYVGVYLASNLPLAFSALTLSVVIGSMTNGPLFAATQALVPPNMRATSLAIILFFCNLIGLGLGPLGAGFLSDLLRPVAGDDSLRFSLLALCPGFLLCAACLVFATKTVSKDVANVAASPLQSAEESSDVQPAIIKPFSG